MRDISDIVESANVLVSPDQQRKDPQIAFRMMLEHHFFDLSKELLAALGDAGKADEPDDMNFSPLHSVANSGRVDLLTILLNYPIDIKRRDNVGWSALHFAAAAGHTDMATMLIARGVEPDAEALHRAAAAGHIDMAIILITEHGVKPDAKALHCAATAGHIDMATMLIAREVEPDAEALHRAAAAGHIGMAAMLIGHDIEPDAEALHRAASAGHTDMAAMLIACGVEPDKKALLSAEAAKLTSLDKTGKLHSFLSELSPKDEKDRRIEAFRRLGTEAKEAVIGCVNKQKTDPRFFAGNSFLQGLSQEMIRISEAPEASSPSETLVCKSSFPA